MGLWPVVGLWDGEECAWHGWQVVGHLLGVRVHGFCAEQAGEVGWVFTGGFVPAVEAVFGVAWQFLP